MRSCSRSSARTSTRRPAARRTPSRSRCSIRSPMQPLAGTIALSQHGRAVQPAGRRHRLPRAARASDPGAPAAASTGADRPRRPDRRPGDVAVLRPARLRRSRQPRHDRRRALRLRPAARSRRPTTCRRRRTRRSPSTRAPTTSSLTGLPLTIELTSPRRHTAPSSCWRRRPRHLHAGRRLLRHRQLRYRVTDGLAVLAAGARDADGHPVNDAPVASDVSVTTAEDSAAHRDAGRDRRRQPGADLHGSLTGPSHGTVTVVAGGFSYQPAADFNGADSFTYVANDGSLDSNVATVIADGHSGERRAGRPRPRARPTPRTRRSPGRSPRTTSTTRY